MNAGTPCIAAAILLNNRLPLSIIEKLEQGAGLAVIVIAIPVIVSVGVAVQRQRRLAIFRIARRRAE